MSNRAASSCPRRLGKVMRIERWLITGFGAQFGWWAQSGSLDALSGDALRHRHAEPGHPVQHRAADPGFGLLGRQSPGAQAATDDSFVAEHGGLPKRAPAVADRRLPAQAPLV